MPWKDPEKYRAYKRKYNREYVRERRFKKAQANGAVILPVIINLIQEYEMADEARKVEIEYKLAELGILNRRTATRVLLSEANQGKED